MTIKRDINSSGSSVLGSQAGLRLEVFYQGTLVSSHIGVQFLPGDGTSRAFLTSMYILKNYRRRGHGTKTIEFVIQALVDICLEDHVGLDNMPHDLCVRNPKSIGFYARLGFEIIKLKHFYIHLIYLLPRRLCFEHKEKS